jgi:hypothetical protein
MANEKPPKNKANGGGGEKSKTPSKPARERPFDMWLQKQLHSMYDEIAAEPLPEDLLNLIDKDADKSKN